MIELLYKLIACHFVGDYVFQNDFLAKTKGNNVWADAGNVTVDFAADIKTYIDNKFAELQALVLDNN